MEKENLLEKFLNKQNIFISKKNKHKRISDIENIINAIVDFHKAISGKRNYTLGIISEVGKVREEQKLFIRRVKELKEKMDINCEEILESAIRSTHIISEHEFLYLVERAVLNSEITVGKSAINTFKSEEGKIFIKDNNRIRFGMKEDDFIKIIIKYRKKECDFEYNSIKKLFLEKEGLDNKSSRYIDSVLKYPYKEMKYLSDIYINDFTDVDIINAKLSDFNECNKYN